MNTIKLIKRHEGTGPVRNGRFYPYQDSEDLLTIGYGFCLERSGLSMAEAAFILSNRVAEVTSHCLQEYLWFITLNDTRQAVVVSMVYNLGESGFRGFSKTIEALMSGDYDAAASEMLDSKWAGQVGNRAVELSEMMKTGRFDEP